MSLSQPIDNTAGANTLTASNKSCFKSSGSTFAYNALKNTAFALAVIAAVGLVVGALIMSKRMDVIAGAVPLSQLTAPFYLVISCSVYLGLYSIVQLVRKCTERKQDDLLQTTSVKIETLETGTEPVVDITDVQS